jgi:signal transduction histidine kinase
MKQRQTNNVNISIHDLRNLLTALASSGLLLENYIQAEKQKEKQLRHIRLIRQSTEELIKHVDEYFPEKQF